MAEITRERIDALASEYDAIIAHVLPRASRLNTARGYSDTPRGDEDITWSIEPGDNGRSFTGRWEEYQCGERERYSIGLDFADAAMTDAEFDVRVAEAEAATVARRTESVRREREQADANDRAALARLQARIATRETAEAAQRG